MPGGIHGIDSQLHMLAPGELVIPSTHAAAHMVQAKREGIPGMASGGVVGSPQATVANVQQGITTAQNAIGTFTSGAMKSWISQLNTAFAAKQAAAAGAGGAFTGNVPGGSANLLVIAKYLLANGLNAAAAAGIAATIDGESGGNPESVGSGGFGLIGWTGNTIGLPPGYHGPTGNPQYDMSVQLPGVIGYMNSRGGRGPLNAAGNPVAAGDVWSRYEAPLVPLSDTRPGVANQLYAELGGAGASAKAAATASANLSAGVATLHGHSQGGIIRPNSGGGVINEPVLGYGMNSGIPYSFAENGQPEFVSNQSHSVTAQPGMQPATNIGQQQLISLMQMLVKQNQQLPYAIGGAVSQGAGNGVKHGYYGAQN